jgi:hypothetical protein
MTNEEKATMIAEQCKPCSDDFYSGMKQGVLLALNAEASNLEKAKQWDELGDKISACYVDEYGNELSEEASEHIDLCTIGELAAIAFGWM